MDLFLWIVLLFAGLAVPVAYLLLAMIRGARSRVSVAGLMCGGCGYSLVGLAAGARCPECAGVKRAGQWPSGAVTLVCVAASQLPSLIGVLRFIDRGASGSWVPAWLVVAVLLPLLCVPAAVACWVVCVVVRAGVRWLSLAALVMLAGLPLLVGVAMALSAAGGHRDMLAREIEWSVLMGVGPVVTVFLLAAFSVCGLVMAAVMETLRAVRSPEG